MNKSQLISAVAEEIKLSKIEVKKVVDTLFKCVEKNLKDSDKVVISGFGVFTVNNTPERMGRNPRTGEPVKIEPRRNVKFRSNMEIK
ncbi:MAG: HU family DNA-binding protein [Alistipes sp.]|nr:HU family DNA-binding protein [Alistipes sp.]